MPSKKINTPINVKVRSKFIRAGSTINARNKVTGDITINIDPDFCRRLANFEENAW